MSYSEEEQQAYQDLQWKMQEFKNLKDEIKEKKCSTHNKKLKVSDS